MDVIPDNGIIEGGVSFVEENMNHVMILGFVLLWMGTLQCERASLGLPRWNGKLSSLITPPPPVASRTVLRTTATTIAHQLPVDTSQTAPGSRTEIWPLVFFSMSLMILLVSAIFIQHIREADATNRDLQSENAALRRRIMALESQVYWNRTSTATQTLYNGSENQQSRGTQTVDAEPKNVSSVAEQPVDFASDLLENDEEDTLQDQSSAQNDKLPDASEHDSQEIEQSENDNQGDVHDQEQGLVNSPTEHIIVNLPSSTELALNEPELTDPEPVEELETVENPAEDVADDAAEEQPAPVEGGGKKKRRRKKRVLSQARKEAKKEAKRTEEAAKLASWQELANS